MLWVQGMFGRGLQQAERACVKHPGMPPCRLLLKNVMRGCRSSSEPPGLHVRPAHPARLLPPCPCRVAGLPEWARCVVFDEADLLLSGAYGAQMRIIWDALRAGDRLHAARRVCAQVRCVC